MKDFKELYPKYAAFREQNLDKLMIESGLARDDSYDSIRCKVMDAINANIRAGTDMDGDNDGPQDAIEGAYAWCQDMYPGVCVYSMNGKLFRVNYTIDGDHATVGTPVAVEMAYNDKTESNRVMSNEALQLKEGAYDATSGKLTIRVIEAGFNKSKQRYYPAGVLKRDFKIFEGAKMFVDHQTDQEAKVKPEGSVNNWVANVTKVWAESDGTIMGESIVIDPQFKAKLDKLHEAKMLNEMGVSIRAIGEASRKVVDGVETNYVESLVKARSVDFVTYAGAGGQVETMESDRDAEHDVDLLNEAELRKRRPDLVTLIETSARQSTSQGEAKLKSLELQLKEANDALAAKTTELNAANAKLKESDKKIAGQHLESLLKEANLPEVAQKRLKDQFKEADKIDGMKEAVDAEAAYIKSLSPNAGTGKVTGLGVKQNGVQESDRVVEQTAEQKKAQRKQLRESFQSLGMTKEEAKLAVSRELGD